MASNRTKSSAPAPAGRLHGIYYFHAPRQRTVSRRVHERASLIVMLGGRYGARWNGGRLQARPGDIVCWRKGDARVEENDPERRTRCLVLDFEWAAHPEGLPRVARDSAGLMRMLALRLFSLTKDPAPVETALWNAYLNALLAEYLRMSRHRARGLLDRVNQCLEEHLGERFTLRDLARWIGLERHHLGRRFKQEAGISPMRHIRAQRVQHALGYLATSPYWTTRRIAERVGIPDDVQLRRLIRRFTGMGIRDIRTRIPENERLPFAQTIMRESERD